MAKKLAPAAPCPCGSGNTYKTCCQPYHLGTAPPTPDALMRARYTAYFCGDVGFIINTTHPDSPYQQADRKTWRKDLKRYCDETQFVGLNMMSTSVEGDVGHVAFKAVLMRGGRDASFTENSRFERQGGKWYYIVAEKS
jgi:SEC-C motif-containing protein